MDFPGLLAQLLNGVQYGLLLFLIASGLTLIFGVMGIINLAHGSLFMIGAYVAFLVARHWGSVWLALPVAILGGIALGAALERGLFRYFYAREHLDQVLLTFALILLFEEARSLCVGNDFYSVPVPALLDFSVPITAGFSYSAYRFAVIGVCLRSPRCCSGGSSAPRWAPSSAPRPRSRRWSTCSASMRAACTWRCSPSARRWRWWPACWRRRSTPSIPTWATASSSSPSWWW